jgi:Beta-lactamase
VEPKLEATTASIVKQHRLPGAAVGVVHGDALVRSAGVGFADIASRRVPDVSTLHYVFVVALGVRESGERVTFRRRADGRVTSMFLAVATMVRFGPVGTE